MQKENFEEFFQRWSAEQKQHLDELIAASRLPTSKTSQQQNSSSLCGLIERVVSHYEEYYKVKSHCTKQNVLLMLSPTWTTSLEDAFLWIGGWRPTMAIHLLYSKSGLQLEFQLTELAQGLPTGDLADLCQNQLVRIDKVQRETIREEREITEKMAKHQAKVADPEMVELTHELSEDRGRVESALRNKEQGLENILERADDLRLRTLKGVIEILSPTQALHFLIAAAELHLRLHEWGKQRETKQLNIGVESDSVRSS